MYIAPSHILMIRPSRFGFNKQTAGSNAFQKKQEDAGEHKIQEDAVKEFDALVEKLKAAGIAVEVIQDTEDPHTPDSIFPNNWISFHRDNLIVIYPMLAENRRKERRKDIIDKLRNEQSRILDLSFHEQKNIFLEGTGSIVFDYEHKIAYANISPRTNRLLLLELCGRLDYKAITFSAKDNRGIDIYHTNVLMCIGKGFAVLCRDCIPDKKEQETLIGSLEHSGHEVIEISYEQMEAFAGNMYQLFNAKGESIIVMSEQAYRALDAFQIVRLEKYGRLLFSPLYTIERYGGGSARCMMAEVSSH
jgi:hypothetical protein